MIGLIIVTIITGALFALAVAACPAGIILNSGSPIDPNADNG